MTDIDPKSLRLFAAVCDARNIKQAAAQEHIEPSAISKRITQLEAQLGVALLVRGRRGVQVTPAGQALLEHTRGLLFTLDRLHADVAAFAGGIKGQVRLVASASAIAELLLEDLSIFMRMPEHAEIQVDIEERNSRDIVRGVREGSASIGVCWDMVDFDELKHQAYRDDELVLAVPAGHALAHRRSIRFAQTLAFDHVGLPPATAVHTMLGRAAARAGASLTYRVIVSNFDSSLRVVAAGLAVSVIPRLVVERSRSLGIVGITLAESWAKRRFAICYRDLDSLTPAAARLVEHLAACAKVPASKRASAPRGRKPSR